MSSIIKVDQIQTTAGGTPTASDLGLNVEGNILQVKHHVIDPGTQSTTSTSLVATGLTVDITPKSTASNMLILVCMNECYVSVSNDALSFAIARNGSRLSDTDNATLGYHSSGGSNYFNVNLHSYDSPNTTSQVTYSVLVKSRYGRSVKWCSDNTPAFLTVLEIAG
jgi:hypothetical protein